MLVALSIVRCPGLEGSWGSGEVGGANSGSEARGLSGGRTRDSIVQLVQARKFVSKWVGLRYSSEVGSGTVCWMRRGGEKRIFSSRANFSDTGIFALGSRDHFRRLGRAE